jgi:hypothetical protein
MMSIGICLESHVHFLWRRPFVIIDLLKLSVTRIASTNGKGR